MIYHCCSVHYGNLTNMLVTCNKKVSHVLQSDTNTGVVVVKLNRTIQVPKDRTIWCYLLKDENIVFLVVQNQNTFIKRL